MTKNCKLAFYGLFRKYTCNFKTIIYNFKNELSLFAISHNTITTGIYHSNLTAIEFA